MKYIFFISLVWLTTFAQAQTIQTDRPQFAVSGNLQPVKTFNVETGVAATFVDKEHLLMNYNVTSFRIGMMPLMEMNVTLRAPGYIDRLAEVHQAGFASPRLGLKVRMKEKTETSKLGLAFVGSTSINFGSKQFKDTKILPAFRVAMDIDATEKINLRVNYGVQWLEDKSILDPEDNPVINPFIVLALNSNFVITEKTTLFAEYFANLKYNNLRNDHYIHAGCLFKVADNLQIDISGGAGLSPRTPRGFVNLGFSGWWPKKNFATQD